MIPLLQRQFSPSPSKWAIYLNVTPVAEFYVSQSYPDFPWPAAFDRFTSYAQLTGISVATFPIIGYHTTLAELEVRWGPIDIPKPEPGQLGSTDIQSWAKQSLGLNPSQRYKSIFWMEPLFAKVGGEWRWKLAADGWAHEVMGHFFGCLHQTQRCAWPGASWVMDPDLKATETKLWDNDAIAMLKRNVGLKA